MARQDINEALAQTGFLYGGNAAYIEDLYARYEADPKSVDEQWQSFFARAAGRQAVGHLENAKGAVLEEAELADPRQWRADLGARRQLGVVEKVVSDKLGAKAKAAGATLRAGATCSRRRAIPCAPSC